MNKQKWIFENDEGIYFPISATVQLHITPGPGVFKIVKNSNPNDQRIGLLRISETEKFEFVGKVYDLDEDGFMDKVMKCWDSDIFSSNKKNLCVALNGLKGSGKTYMAKQLANKMEMPILVLDNDFHGAVIDFLTSIEFECVVLIDEAEKIFNKDEGNTHVLLRILDGVNNAGRKLYILTTNEFNINDNLVGRPGRVRYIKKFISLPKKTVLEVIEDELQDKSKTDYILEIVEELSISTIDVLRCIIEEVNIFGEVDKKVMSLPLASYTYNVILFPNLNMGDIERIKEILARWNPGNEDLMSLFGKKVRAKYNDEDAEEDTWEVSELIGRDIYEKAGARVPYDFGVSTLSVGIKVLFEGLETNQGDIVEAPNKDGYFLYREKYRGDLCLGLILGLRGAPSLYNRGLIA